MAEGHKAFAGSQQQDAQELLAFRLDGGGW